MVSLLNGSMINAGLRHGLTGLIFRLCHWPTMAHRPPLASTLDVLSFARGDLYLRVDGAVCGQASKREIWATRSQATERVNPPIPPPSGGGGGGCPVPLGLS